jgi:hypothetical protein
MKTMKTTKLIITTIFFLFLSISIFAQPDPPGDDHGGGNDVPAGGGAAISGGMIVMLALGAGYGGKKVYDLKKKGNILK